jgi:hypothetical protein
MDASTSATSMPPLGKGNGDCFHYQIGNSPLSRNGSSVSGSLRSGPWKLYEDQLLADAVKRIGPHNWTRVAACVPGRSGKSCRLRWCNQLNPHVNKVGSALDVIRVLACSRPLRRYINTWTGIRNTRTKIRKK